MNISLFVNFKYIFDKEDLTRQALMKANNILNLVNAESNLDKIRVHVLKKKNYET